MFFVLIRVFSIPSHPPISSVPSYVSPLTRLNKPTNFVDRTVKRLYPEPQASLLSGILVGTKSQMPKDFYNALQKTGTMHIIALSGTNISFLIIGISYILGGFLGKIPSSVITLITIITFILFVGPSASVVRAGIMGSLAVLSFLFGRQYIAILGLIITGIMMIVISPATIFNIGFQLSFMATMSILLITRKSAVRSRQSIPSRVKDGLLMDLNLTIYAQIFTLPIVVYNFQTMSFIAPVSNILISWTIPILMTGGFIIILISQISLISPISLILLPFLSYFITTINFTASLPFSSAQTFHIPLWSVYLYYAILFIILGVVSLRATERSAAI